MWGTAHKPEAAEVHLKVGRMLAGLTHWQSPNFFAYFPANSSFPAMLGDMLSGALSVMGFLWSGSPAATELEAVSPAHSLPCHACHSSQPGTVINCAVLY